MRPTGTSITFKLTSSLFLPDVKLKTQNLEREAKECRARTEEWYFTALRSTSQDAECERVNLTFVSRLCSQQQLRRCQAELSRQVKQSSSVIQEKVPFNDTSE